MTRASIPTAVIPHPAIMASGPSPAAIFRGRLNTPGPTMDPITRADRAPRRNLPLAGASAISADLADKFVTVMIKLRAVFRSRVIPNALSWYTSARIGVLCVQFRRAIVKTVRRPELICVKDSLVKTGKLLTSDS